MLPRRCRSSARSIASARMRRLRDLACDQSGSIIVEAALVFPILIMLFLGVSEFSEAFTVSRRIDVAANTAADLVARMPSVTSGDLAGIKAMIDEGIKPFPVASLGVVITSVVADNDNATTVAWSEALGAGVTAHGTGAPITLPDGLTVAKGSLVLAEVTYQFKSTLSTLLVGSVPLQAKAFQLPRYSGKVVKN